MDRILKKMTVFVALAFILCGVGLMSLTVFDEAFASSIQITETWSVQYPSDVAFTVANNGYEYIREFAIGNNFASGAWVDTGGPSNPQYLTTGKIAIKYDFGDDSNHIYQWWVDQGTQIERRLTWLEGASDFDSYGWAFLYTSWDANVGGYTGYLEHNSTTIGYIGTTAYLMSPFAAYYDAGGGDTGIITGNTIEGAPVPIPPTVWLLGSGLIGLAGLRRRFRQFLKK